jgi:hypothetical protein
MKPLLIVRRYEYEEPYHTQLEFVVSNGLFCGSTDIYCNVAKIKEIGSNLKRFPQKFGDEYRYEYGSENVADRFYRYFLMRAYTKNTFARCAIQFKINLNTEEPNEGLCIFSILADTAQINKLGDLFVTFSELKHMEFHWSPTSCEMYEKRQCPSSTPLTS